MTGPAAGEERREGLFAALKNSLATVLAMGKTRAELLVAEIEEEKYRLISMWATAIAAAFLLAVGVILAVFWLALVFWEQRLLVLGLFSLLFVVAALLLVGLLRRQARQPSRLFRGSLAELAADVELLRSTARKPE